MACVQGTWWGVGGGVVGGWWGFWFWCWVPGWGWGLGLGCLVGGGVWWVGSGFGWWGGVACGGLFPLDPSLTPPPAAWCAVVLGSGRPSVGWWLLFCWWLSVGCSSFLGGWAGLVGGLSCWLCSGWFVLNLGGGLLFLLVVQVRPCGCWGCSVVAGSVGCVLVGGLFFCWLCCSRWEGRPGRSGSSSPPLSPPRYTTGPSRPPDSVGELTR
mgnify:CR=1 FL=1|jgi:hypothetical protein